MHRRWLGFIGLVAVAFGLLSASSCGHDHTLVSISVTPTDVSITLSALGEQVPTQFTAIGNYIHPPDNRDITSTAIWSTDSPSALTISTTTPGLVTTTGFVCGSGLGVSATVYHDPSNPQSSSVVIGTATMSIAGC